ncbi:DNA (cytosine-5-)-methyltransferase [Rhizobium sp.]|uniref:DNA cytosine methyltransferase n=1 Tax=Rhizobium sp. TaxID=391 RepID=UPI0028B1E13E
MALDERQTIGLSESGDLTAEISAKVDVGMAPPIFHEIDPVDADGLEASSSPPKTLAPEALATALAREKAKRLKWAANKIVKARGVITEKLLAIADLLEDARDDLRRPAGQGGIEPPVSAARLRAYARQEAGIPADEIATYLQLASIAAEERQVLRQNGAGFSVLKAVATDAGLRGDVVDRMQAGVRMDIAAVRRVRQERRLAAETMLESLLRQRPELGRLASRTETRAAIRAFETAAGQFVSDLVAFHSAVDLPDEDYSHRGEGISREAKRLLGNLEAIVDCDDMPDEWYDLGAAGLDWHGFEAARIALISIAYEEFFVKYGSDYLDSDDVNLDWRLVVGVGRLAGIAPAELSRPDSARISTAERGKGNSTSARRAAAQPARPMLVEPPRALRSIEICAGAGGQALGLHAAGFRARAIFEVMGDAAETLRANFATAVPRIFTEDITKVDFRHYRGGIDLVAGGVPCQPYSTAGERQGEADERDLFRRAVEIVDEIQPRAFFFENVEGFGHATNMSYRAELHAAFAAIGYQSRIFPILGSDYGLAQGRPRVAFIGFKDPDVMARFRMPPTFPHWNPTLADAIGDLVSAKGWRGHEAWSRIANRLGPTIVGGSRKSDKHSFSSGLTRRAWADLGIDSSSLTKSAPAADHLGPFKLTLDMGARLQGFPDDWRFVGRDRQIKSQIGNALPPVMARAVGLAIYAALENVAFDFETVLKTPFHWPSAPEPVKFLPASKDGQSKLRSQASYARQQRLQRIRDEHDFFGEIIDDVDDQGEPLDSFIDPGAYRLRERQS